MSKSQLKILLLELQQEGLSKKEYDMQFNLFYEQIKNQVFRRCFNVTRLYQGNMVAKELAKDIANDIAEMLYIKHPFKPEEDDDAEIVDMKFYVWISKTARNLYNKMDLGKTEHWDATKLDAALSVSDDVDTSNDTDQERDGDRVQTLIAKVGQIVNRYLKPRAKDLYYRLIKPYGGHLQFVPKTEKLQFIKDWNLTDFDHLRSFHNDTLNRIRRYAR